MKLILGFVFFLLGMTLFFQARKRLQAAGLPGGQIIYSDTQRWEKPKKTLFDPISGVAGRPDYLVKHDGFVVPVEVKSGRPKDPYQSHVFQLAAYCLLVESEFGIRPPYGIIRYQHRSFSIDYSVELEEALRALLTEMRLHDRLENIARSHDHAGRCRGCGFNRICDQRLSE